MNILAVSLVANAQFSQGLPVQAEPLPRRGALGLSFSPAPPEVVAAHKLASGQGLVCQAPIKGLTAEKIGLKAGDIVLTLNGKPVSASMIGSTIRETKSGSTLNFQVVRDGKVIDVAGTLLEKPRDPGTADYSVTYSHVVSHGERMRTIITTPKRPGKFPALFFIQGFSPISYDFTLEGSKGDVTTLDGPILYEFAKSGFVTMRIEKPGVGDSEGGPFPQLDYTTELDIYRQALKQLKALPEVDPSNVFIFGHSMGGAFGPMIACEEPVKGIAVYGTAARTWFEYLLDTLRYQGILGGDSYEQADELVRQSSRLMALVFHEDKSIAEIKKTHPQLSQLADQLMPGGFFNGKSLKFWDQLSDTNFPYYWARCNAHVLAARGISDFVTYDADHRLIADIVNKKNPGWGRFESVPNSDHLFHDFPTEADALKGYSKGTFNPAFTNLLMKWVRDVIADKGSKPG
ncbi:MAG: alpha/beta fold hydrolase [Fimbriimonadaceae bacterium]|nr:alpha/beta fold hydrolase [Fimbriimonadaceae bacterium]